MLETSKSIYIYNDIFILLLLKFISNKARLSDIKSSTTDDSSFLISILMFSLMKIKF